MERFFELMSKAEGVNCILRISVGEIEIVNGQVVIDDFLVYGDNTCIMFYNNLEVRIDSSFGLKTYTDEYGNETFTFVYDDTVIEVEIL